jgi:hypothetical protein
MTEGYETEQEARAAALAAGGPPRDDWAILSEAQRHNLLLGACEAAGIRLGTYDRRIIGWLTHWEDATCAVIAGLITRAHAGALTPEQRTTTLAALADAAKWRDHLGAAECDDCAHAPTGLCERHAEDLDAADDYRRVLAELGGQS